jgi:ribosomal protein S18 acetylase RimI-like enzyme
MSLVDDHDPAHFGRPVGSSGTLEVRLATPTDAEGVAELFVQCVGGSSEEHRQGFLREIAAARSDNLVLVAQSAGQVIGVARARHFEPPAPSSESTAPAGWYLLGVNVLPSHRRQGVGAELTRERLRWIAERADEAFYFTQEENQASIALHARLGFREVSRAVEYPGALDPSSDRVLYRLELSSAGEG